MELKVCLPFRSSSAIRYLGIHYMELKDHGVEEPLDTGPDIGIHYMELKGVFSCWGVGVCSVGAPESITWS